MPLHTSSRTPHTSSRTLAPQARHSHAISFQMDVPAPPRMSCPSTLTPAAVCVVSARAQAGWLHARRPRGVDEGQSAGDLRRGGYRWIRQNQHEGALAGTQGRAYSRVPLRAHYYASRARAASLLAGAQARAPPTRGSVRAPDEGPGHVPRELCARPPPVLAKGCADHHQCEHDSEHYDTAGNQRPITWTPAHHRMAPVTAPDPATRPPPLAHRARHVTGTSLIVCVDLP